MDGMDLVACYVKAVRKRQHMTQSQFGKLVSVSRDSIANYEMGRARPPADVFLRIQEIAGHTKGIKRLCSSEDL